MNNLKVLRQSKGLTQRNLARMIGVNYVTLNRAENGWFAKPPNELETKLQAVFGPEWSWDRLMAPAPEPRPSTPEAP